MTDEQKIDKMFSALRKMAGEPIPDKLVEAVTEIRPDVPTPDEPYERLKDEGYWD